MNYKIVAALCPETQICFASTVGWLLGIDMAVSDQIVLQQSYASHFLASKTHLPAEYLSKWGLKECLSVAHDFEMVSSREAFFFSLQCFEGAHSQFLMAFGMGASLSHCGAIKRTAAGWTWYDTVSNSCPLSGSQDFLEVLARIESVSGQTIRSLELVWYQNQFVPETVS